MPACRVLSISATAHEIEYADHVARQERISRSDVYRRGLRALKRARHDYSTPLQGMMMLADTFERGLINRHEAAGDIRRLVREMDAMRAEASSPQEQEPHHHEQAGKGPAPRARE